MVRINWDFEYLWLSAHYSANRCVVFNLSCFSKIGISPIHISFISSRCFVIFPPNKITSAKVLLNLRKSFWTLYIL